MLRRLVLNLGLELGLGRVDTLLLCLFAWLPHSTSVDQIGGAGGVLAGFARREVSIGLRTSTGFESFDV